MSGAEGSAPDHVKFKVVKNDAGAITQFELFGCTSGSQTYYLSQTISDSSFSMTNKGSSDTGDSSSVTYSASVTGTLNSSGNFTGSKTIDLAYVNDFGGGEGNFCDMTFTQTDVDLTYDGYCRNTGDSTAAEEMFAVVDLVDNDSAVLADWGIGAGAVKIVSDNNTSGEEVTQGWDENGGCGVCPSCRLGRAHTSHSFRYSPFC